MTPEEALQGKDGAVDRYGSGPLGDIRVLELTDEKGQYCGKLLGDMGADVLKVEPPGGAAERRVGPFYQDVPHPDRSLSFWHYNTSKRGITLDLETEAGRDLVRRLAAGVDVLLESYKPGYLPSLGLGYERLREVNPRLVMCSLTPFGQTGPWKDYRTSDLNHLAAGGQMASSGYNDWDVAGAPPIAPGGGNGWHIGGNFAAIAIISALCYRDVAGQGQYIDSSIHEACNLSTESALTIFIHTRQVVYRNTGRHASVNLEKTYPSQIKCRDGNYVNVGPGLRLVPAVFKIFAEWMDRYGMAGDLLDDKYEDAKFLAANLDHVHELLDRFFGTCLTAEEAYRGAQERGLPWGAIRSPDEILADPHWEDRGLFVQTEHPELGKSFTYPGPYALLGASPIEISRRAPLAGEHNLEVFGALGLSPAEVAVLKENGVI